VIDEGYARRVLLYRDVWVDLAALFPPRRGLVPGEGRDTCVDLTGEVEGVLIQWHRGVEGHWLGEVNYTVTNLAGQTQQFTRQLVPAAVLRARRVAAEPGEGPL
jgi:hypothetical protein